MTPRDPEGPVFLVQWQTHSPNVRWVVYPRTQPVLPVVTSTAKRIRGQGQKQRLEKHKGKSSDASVVA